MKAETGKWNCFRKRIGPVRLAVAKTRILTMVFLLGSVPAFGQTVTTLYSFGARSGDGVDPQAGVTFDKFGNLYGATAVGGISGSNDILFKLSPPTGPGDFWTETIIDAFRGQPEGKVPECRLILTSSGRLIGTTLQGGTKNMGTAFAALPPSAPGGPWTVSMMYSFGRTPDDGVNPNAGLLPASPGFYGVTFGGGAQGKGTVFELTPPNGGGSWTETILYSFAGDPDAAFPSSQLVMDKSGNLYGTTTLGGANDLGAVYQLSPPAQPGDPWTEAVIYSFSGPDGTLPAGRLQFDSSGALYGTTDGGGERQEGTVFQLTPPTIPGNPWTEAVLYGFSGGNDGGNPSAGVVIDNAGRLFGTASTGGDTRSGGVVFRLTPPAGGGVPWNETVLHSFKFDRLDGFRPISILTFKNGKMYGVTSEGGNFGTGTVFELAP
jgi:uncharacterized repeat protein (TIGR03803 family)